MTVLASMTACQIGQAVIALLPLELQITLLEHHAKRLNTSVAINFKEGLVLSADHRWHQEFSRANGGGKRNEHPDMSG